MEDLIAKQSEERKKFANELKNKEKEHKRQIWDLIKAKKTEIKDQRKRLQANNEKLNLESQRLKAMNEQNLQTIKRYCDTVNNPGNNASLHGARSPTVPQEQSELATQTENITSAPQGPLPNANTSTFVTEQTELAIERSARLRAVQGDMEVIETPDFFDQFLGIVSMGAPAMGEFMAVAAPPVAPFAGIAGKTIGAAPAFIKEVRKECTIM